MTVLTINGRATTVEAPPDKPLLWVLREDLGLVGTKYGCGIAACGACTVLVDGQAVRSCVTPVSVVAGKRVTTIEGLAEHAPVPAVARAVQQAWIEAQVPQCGYCQPGFITAATALLSQRPAPGEAEIEAALTNLCRCGTYPAMRVALRRAAERVQKGEG
jgi:isoquinoline 1-oxidoreductase alpha subunit